MFIVMYYLWASYIKLKEPILRNHKTLFIPKMVIIMADT